MWFPLIISKRRALSARLLSGVFLALCITLSGCNPSAERPNGPASAVDLNGDPFDPISAAGTNAAVLIFVRPDCPISNRYLPELRRLHDRFAPGGAQFWFVYADIDVSAPQVLQHMEEFQVPGKPLRDPKHVLVRRCNARVTPDAAVFQNGRLMYHGRIDDRYAALGADHGSPSHHDLEQVLDALASGRAVTTPSAPAVGCAITGEGQ